jgi:riboflavin synthase
MFTGIIEEQGRVVHVGHGVLRIDAHEVLGDVTVGASITVDGISLTVVKPLDDGFTAAIIPHTAATSNDS